MPRSDSAAAPPTNQRAPKNLDGACGVEFPARCKAHYQFLLWLLPTARHGRLVPAIHVFARAMGSVSVVSMRGGWVYIVTNRTNGTLYTGVTSNISRRAYEHRQGLIEGFTRRYGLKRLMWMEFHEDIRAAIQRESNIKYWPRAWKVRLIHAENSEWRDLYDELNW